MTPRDFVCQDALAPGMRPCRRQARPPQRVRRIAQQRPPGYQFAESIGRPSNQLEVVVEVGAIARLIEVERTGVMFERPAGRGTFGRNGQPRQYQRNGAGSSDR